VSVGDDGRDGALPLVAENISVRFGGVVALAGVSLRVEAGEVVGLIGGNGAGKSTFMDCVSGYVRPQRGGGVSLFGNDVTHLAPELRPYLGIVRSFQDARLYPGLSVSEALLVAVERHRPSGLLASLLNLRSARRAESEKRAWVDELTESMGLVAFREKRIKELSTGTRRVVDLATTIAQRPRLVLLDEPTTGLAQRETEAFGPLVRWVQQRLACAVLIVEHDIPLMTSIADRAYALQAGSLIASGDPAAVVADPAVIASFLGEDEVAIHRSDAGVSRSAASTRRTT
jgi:ABC-type branched-subunit amino acid transport system ATPase component